MMGRFQSCRAVVERALRRAFYDGVLELYEGHGNMDTVTAVSLEGMLTLTINKTETLVIRLNEVAQRAEEVAGEDGVAQDVKLESESDRHGSGTSTSTSTNNQKETQIQLNQNISDEKNKKRKLDVEKTEDDKTKIVKVEELPPENSRAQVETARPNHDSVHSESDPKKKIREIDTLPENSLSHETLEKPLNMGTDLGPPQVFVKLEPPDSPASSPPPLSSVSERNGDGDRMQPMESKTHGERYEEPLSKTQEKPTAPQPVAIKKEPKAESILIEDDDDDSYMDSLPQDYSRLPPSRSLWHKMPVGSRYHASPRHKHGSRHRERKYSAGSHDMDTAGADPHEMALLLERNDCPVCGEVLHTRPELSAHLHAHRHVLRGGCSVCRANTLTLDALMLHLSTVHGPSFMPTALAASSPVITAADPLLGHHALIPTSSSSSSPYSSMSAIASLVSMAACQAAAASAAAVPATNRAVDAAAAAFLGRGGGGGGVLGGMGVGGGVSGLMEQIVASYHQGLLPCPVCQLLCSSRQHLLSHLALAHAPAAPDLNFSGGREAGDGSSPQDLFLPGRGDDGLGGVMFPGGNDIRESHNGSSVFPGGNDVRENHRRRRGGGNDADTLPGSSSSLSPSSPPPSSSFPFSPPSSSSSSSSSFSCFDCSLGFGSQGAYSQHCLLQHGTASVVSQGSCSLCQRAFDTWKALHAHYLAVHHLTNFCERCKLGFSSAAELRAHYEATSHLAGGGGVGVGGGEGRSLTFICDICNKGFYSQSQCSAHKRSHISEKSFACQVCGSAFFKRGDLSKHFRTVHAPNRVFACRFCGKRGTRMDNMRSHVKSHGKHMTRDEILSFIEEVKS